MAIHTHDNLGLGISNTLHAIDEGITWVDSTETGMGRSPGDTLTEELVIEIAEKRQRQLHMVPLMKLINQHFKPMQSKYGWGINQCCRRSDSVTSSNQSCPLVVSGGGQRELRGVFQKRGIDHLFDGGIFGSPDAKDTILARESTTQNIARPALFLVDSYYDYKASRDAGLDFIFLNGWSEWQPDAEWGRREGIYSACFLKDLLDA
ncbi:hypothetical protein [Marinobacter lipolyticus]|uniref:hypothetical protein n=1 Tax=Marinobacter lipolyticus TaxID=209639 RepID=UPI003A8F9914